MSVPRIALLFNGANENGADHRVQGGIMTKVRNRVGGAPDKGSTNSKGALSAVVVQAKPQGTFHNDEGDPMLQGKRGRPGKKEQTRPLIFERLRSRISRPVTMSAKTAEDLDRYVMWAAEEVDADQEEALTLTLDQALGEFFKRDKLYQCSLEDKTESGNGSTVKATATTGNATARTVAGGNGSSSSTPPARTNPPATNQTQPAVQP